MKPFNEFLQEAQPFNELFTKIKPKQYRKKPVVIEAIKWDGSEECWLAMVEFIGPPLIGRPAFNVLKIKTLEGDMFAFVGDMIIKGVAGEFYPCKPDIFVKTYEEVETA